MNFRNIHVIQEGGIIDEDVYEIFHNYLEPRDSYIEKNNLRVSNFVGIIFTPFQTLISMPKLFFSHSELKEFSLKNKEPKRALLHLLFSTFSRYKKERLVNTRNREESEELFESFPFEALFNILGSYRDKGLHHEILVSEKNGYSGKIQWQKTFKQSEPFFGEKGMVYLPFVVNDTNQRISFMGKCTAFILNSISSKFPDMLGPEVNLPKYNDAIFNNPRKVLSKLYEIRKNLFKDNERFLIKNLIQVFEFLNPSLQKVYIKTYSFENIWEDMIYDLIRYSFNYINDRDKLNFSQNTLPSPNKVEKHKINPGHLEKEHRGFTIIPDFYMVKNRIRYIMDAKYYNEVTMLDYKQIAYYFLLKNYQSKDNKGELKYLRTHNVLIYPLNRDFSTSSYTRYHFCLHPDFNKNEADFNILEYHKDVHELMKFYSIEKIQC